ncbi:sodium-coupled monocarboxylate transporter 1 [Drosophila guanche]|uniref:Blast:Sodium-coupled monocarboxylate transporter 1 n=1 Tax=Drosophila guanche TaxID=7266 RepID=A0A3B0JRX9_DROGU|nr:sodium-coupled monocarboxylate transporter 1 [Drosophila guanche]SPP84877.1 blast:Sodium-coupled monocarboxylate transporter 1 [Drosophila guanche]
MFATQDTILKLLTLCALAHSITAYALQEKSPAGAKGSAALDPSHKYLIVRGESPASVSQEHVDFDNAATLLLQAYKSQQTTAPDGLEECSAPSHKPTFSGYDYVILLGMLVISLGIGIFYGFFQKGGSSSNEFLLGSEMNIFPVTLSLTTSFITAIELLGNPSEMYFQGTQFVLIVIPMVLVIPVAVKIFYPIYFKMELTSCYEYLGIRFGKEIRILGAVLYVIQMCFYTAVAVLAPAIALSKATGLDTKIAVILIYVVCVFYSSQGGMKAVVIADTFQAAVLAVSLVLIVGLGSYYSGTPIQVFQKAAQLNRLEFFNIDPNPTTRHTVWSVVIGGFFYWTSLFCTNQASVQKCMSLKSLKLAKIALGFAILGLIVVFLLNFYTGLMVFNHYADCDPLTAGRISATDQLLPFYVINTYEHIYSIAGIFVAGIFAASLGTVASALNSLSAVTCEDLLVNGMNIKISPEKGATYAKWMSLGYGIGSFGLVFIVEHLGGVLQATLTLNGLIGGVTLGLFVLGIACKQANTKGAFYGGLLSLALVIFVGVVAQIASVESPPLPTSIEHCDCHVNVTNILEDLLTESMNPIKQEGFTSWPIFRLSYMWYSMIGCLLTVFLGWFFSLIIDFNQRRNVLKITGKGGIDNEGVSEEVFKSDDSQVQYTTNSTITTTTTTSTAAVDPIPATTTTKETAGIQGHVNHAIRIDDE